MTYNIYIYTYSLGHNYCILNNESLGDFSQKKNTDD